jgi:hypothetical protein
MYDRHEADAWALGLDLFALVTRALSFDPPFMLYAEWVRRRRVLRIVHGDWAWPTPALDEQVQGEPGGVQLLRLSAVRNVVARLLVSDPRRRAHVGALSDELWMHGEAMVPQEPRSFSFLFRPNKTKTQSDTARKHTNNHPFVSIYIQLPPL